jgi:hypothetical protein
MTTSQTYQADGGRLMPEHDQAVAGNVTEPDADLPGPDADPTAPEADRTRTEEPAPHPVIAVAPAGPESAASTGSDSPGFALKAGGRADEPVAGDDGPGSLSLVSAATEVPESIAESHPAGDTASAVGLWNEVQAMFVDDPHASVDRAAGLVNHQVENLIRSLGARQRSIQSAWQADDAGTEDLRVALQHYRTFWNSLEDLHAQD